MYQGADLSLHRRLGGCVGDLNHEVQEVGIQPGNIQVGSTESETLISVAINLRRNLKKINK